MSRSRKDAAGGHNPNSQYKEVWSRRCRKVSMWNANGSNGYKRFTHRFERREGRRHVQRYIAYALLFTLAAIHGRHSARAVLNRTPTARLPIVSLLRVHRATMPIGGVER